MVAVAAGAQTGAEWAVPLPTSGTSEPRATMTAVRTANRRATRTSTPLVRLEAGGLPSSPLAETRNFGRSDDHKFGGEFHFPAALALETWPSLDGGAASPPKEER